MVRMRSGIWIHTNTAPLICRLESWTWTGKQRRCLAGHLEMEHPREPGLRGVLFEVSWQLPYFEMWILINLKLNVFKWYILKNVSPTYHWLLRTSRQMAPVAEEILGCHTLVTNRTWIAYRWSSMNIWNFNFRRHPTTINVFYELPLEDWMDRNPGSQFEEWTFLQHKGYPVDRWSPPTIPSRSHSPSSISY